MEQKTLDREPIEGCVRPVCSRPLPLLLLLLPRHPLRLDLSGQVREESLPAPVVVLLPQSGLSLQTAGQYSGQVKSL